jgi:hypothetical protein
MTRHRNPNRNRLDPTHVPQKPALTLDMPDDFEENETPIPGVAIIGTKFQPFGGGTSYEEDDDGLDRLTAPVNLPERNSMAVNLVPIDLVNQLEECREDEVLIMAFFWAVIGLLGGIIINWITANGTKPTDMSIGIAGILVLLAIAVGYYWKSKHSSVKKKQTALKASMSRAR